MTPTEATTQGESRTETLTMRLTKTEKRAVRVVAGVRGIEESNLLRELPLSEVLEEFGRIKSAA